MTNCLRGVHTDTDLNENAINQGTTLFIDVPIVYISKIPASYYLLFIANK